MNQLAAHAYPALDGWRGISILCVLAAHILPIGPKFMQLNSTFGPLGMALFFTLSGFLITNLLLRNPSVIDFLIRRFFRIIPLAWLYIWGGGGGRRDPPGIASLDFDKIANDKDFVI